MFDTVIRGGTVIDGTGGPAFDADVGIIGSRIAAIGPRLGPALQEIDARGRIVTPGFVDVHTHYDAQAVWSNELSPSSVDEMPTAAVVCLRFACERWEDVSKANGEFYFFDYPRNVS